MKCSDTIMIDDTINYNVNKLSVIIAWIYFHWKDHFSVLVCEISEVIKAFIFLIVYTKFVLTDFSFTILIFFCGFFEVI